MGRAIFQACMLHSFFFPRLLEEESSPWKPPVWLSPKRLRRIAAMPRVFTPELVVGTLCNRIRTSIRLSSQYSNDRSREARLLLPPNEPLLGSEEHKQVLGGVNRTIILLSSCDVRIAG